MNEICKGLQNSWRYELETKTKYEKVQNICIELKLEIWEPDAIIWGVVGRGPTGETGSAKRREL